MRQDTVAPPQRAMDRLHVEGESGSGQLMIPCMVARASGWNIHFEMDWQAVADVF